MNPYNRKGQVSLWVIISSIIVIVIIVFFSIQKNPLKINSFDKDVQSYIKECTKKSIDNSLKRIIPQGGFITNMDNITYEGIDVSYLCQNVENYKQCINQHPMLIREEEKEIENGITPEVNACFESYKNSMEKEGFQISTEPIILKVSLVPDKVIVEIQKKFSITKNDQNQIEEKYKIETFSPIYDLSIVALDISEQQAKNCYFEYVGYMLLNPKFDIKVTTIKDSVKIYSIMDKDSRKTMNVAIRSCAIPAGG